jgi:KDO2-lipid IV(A) lauroyltransferase
MNGLARLLSKWGRDEAWLAAAARVPPAERRAWLASAGAEAFANDWGGYASFLRANTAGLDYIWPASESEEILRRHTQLLLVNLSDAIDFRTAARKHSSHDVILEGADHLRAAIAEGRGVLAVSAHQSHPGFGFFHPAWNELGISTVANLGALDAFHSSALLDGLGDRVELLPTTAAALRPMLARLSSGGCVAVYGDYVYPGTPGIVSTLFGGPALISSALVALASRSGAALVPLSVSREWPPEDGPVRVRICAPIPLGDLDARDPAARARAALRIGVATECLIRRDPSTWRLWASLHYQWRTATKALQRGAAGASRNQEPTIESPSAR